MSEVAANTASNSIYNINPNAIVAKQQPEAAAQVENTNTNAQAGEAGEVNENKPEVYDLTAVAREYKQQYNGDLITIPARIAELLGEHGYSLEAGSQVPLLSKVFKDAANGSDCPVAAFKVNNRYNLHATLEAEKKLQGTSMLNNEVPAFGAWCRHATEIFFFYSIKGVFVLMLNIKYQGVEYSSIQHVMQHHLNWSIDENEKKISVEDLQDAPTSKTMMCVLPLQPAGDGDWLTNMKKLQDQYNIPQPKVIKDKGAHVGHQFIADMQEGLPELLAEMGGFCCDLEDVYDDRIANQRLTVKAGFDDQDVVLTMIQLGALLFKQTLSTKEGDQSLIKGAFIRNFKLRLILRKGVTWDDLRNVTEMAQGYKKFKAFADVTPATGMRRPKPDAEKLPSPAAHLSNEEKARTLVLIPKMKPALNIGLCRYMLNQKCCKEGGIKTLHEKQSTEQYAFYEFESAQKASTFAGTTVGEDWYVFLNVDQYEKHKRFN